MLNSLVAAIVLGRPQAVYEPMGKIRKDILNAVRPLCEQAMHAKVRFKIAKISVCDDYAYVHADLLTESDQPFTVHTDPISGEQGRPEVEALLIKRSKWKVVARQCADRDSAFSEALYPGWEKTYGLPEEMFK